MKGIYARIMIRDYFWYSEIVPMSLKEEKMYLLILSCLKWLNKLWFNFWFTKITNFYENHLHGTTLLPSYNPVTPKYCRQWRVKHRCHLFIQWLRVNLNYLGFLKISIFKWNFINLMFSTSYIIFLIMKNLFSIALP